MGTPFRHKLTVGAEGSWCTCGKQFEKNNVGAGLAHVRLARRWRYIGRMEFYGDHYYMWEHALTGRQYAFGLDRYQKETLS